MFDFFRKRTAKELIEEAKETYGVPEQKPLWTCPPEPEEKPALTFYRLGLTNNNRVSLVMGYSEITMNRAGVDNMIKLLEAFKDQLSEEEE